MQRLGWPFGIAITNKKINIYTQHQIQKALSRTRCLGMARSMANRGQRGSMASVRKFSVLQK